MIHDASDAEDKPRIVPVFPLPNTVLFPHTALPLHIFEPRYRAMVRDASAGDELIVISLIVGRGFHNLGTLGRIHDLEPLEDGRFNLRLEGLARVALQEVPCDTPYRQVRIEPRPERALTGDPVAIETSRLDLLATLGILRGVGEPAEPILLGSDLPFEVVVNAACAGLPMEASVRQRLLAEDDLVERQRQASGHLAVVMDAITQLGLAESTEDSQLN